MKTRRWIPWGVGIATALGLLLAAGCSDDDEAEDDAGVFGATADGGEADGAVPSEEGSDVAGGDAGGVAAADEADAAADGGAEAEEEELSLVAPKKLAPPDGTVYYISRLKPNVIVTCEWTPVPGAVDYVITRNNGIEPVDFKYYTEGTTFAGRFISGATYTWSVQARDAAGRVGPSSGKARFIIRNLEI